MKNNVAILGAGKIGRALKTMLVQSKHLGSTTLVDAVEAEGVVQVDATDEASVRKLVQKNEGVISALPFKLNKMVARICAEEGKSYFDFTEDTATTSYIQELAKGAKSNVFAPQCGLAPGAINIIGADLIRGFDTVKTLEMRVGALPLSANNSMKYYLSWSSAGLINEYLQPCDALYRGQPIKTMPLEGAEEIVIDGVVYEAFNTSGGVATMVETYAGKVDEMNYKTIRYPGHRDHLKFVIKDLNLESRPELLMEIFETEVPLTGQDVVLLYVNAVGTIDGKLRQKSVIKKISHDWSFTAIQKSTAAGMASVVEMWAMGKLTPGFVKQEEISLEDFTETQWGKIVYG